MQYPKKYVKNHLENVSLRICFLILKLNERYNIKFVQVYASTSTQTEEDVEDL